MPVDTYPSVHVFQRLPLDMQDATRLVLMRGCLHCRIASRRTARYYATAVLERYVRRLHITETDPARWRAWVNRHLMGVARQRAWWSPRWELTCMRDLYWLVGEFSVLIDGVRHDVYQPEHMESVRALARTARKYTGELPRLPLRGSKRARMAIKRDSN